MFGDSPYGVEVYGGLPSAPASSEEIIYHYAKSQSQDFVDPACPIEWGHPLNQGLVSRWKVVPNAGWRGGLYVPDLVRGGKNTNSALFQTSPSWSTQHFPGSYGSLYTSSGNTVSSNDLATRTAGAVRVVYSYWQKRVPGIAQGISRGTNGSSGFGTSWYVNNNIYCICDNGSSAYGCSFNWTIEGWTNIQVAYDGSAGSSSTILRLWVNGSPTSMSYVGTFPSVAPSGGTFWEIGNAFALFEPTYFDDICFWLDRKWTNADAQALYQEQLRGSPETLNWVKSKSYPIFTPDQAADGSDDIYNRMCISVP